MLNFFDLKFRNFSIALYNFFKTRYTIH
jgi:hypothetical protein